MYHARTLVLNTRHILLFVVSPPQRTWAPARVYVDGEERRARGELLIVPCQSAEEDENFAE